jgi:hypothetical protein
MKEAVFEAVIPAAGQSFTELILEARAIFRMHEDKAPRRGLVHLCRFEL